jgi:cytochrome c biogenesis protein CcdA
MSVVLFTLSLSLIDSLTTTFQIIVFVLLLTTEKPLRNSFFYLAGLSGAYFSCGLVGYLTLGQLRLLLSTLLPSSSSVPNPVYYAWEFLMGILMTVFGIWYFYRNKKRGLSKKQSWILLKLKTMNSWFAFGIGAFISITSFPVSPPYLVALGRYWALHLDLPAATGLILTYNIGYALPMVLILVVYLVFRRNTDDYHDSLHEKAKMLNVHLTTWTMAGLGLFSMIDAGCYFAIGQALVKERFF